MPTVTKAPPAAAEPPRFSLRTIMSTDRDTPLWNDVLAGHSETLLRLFTDDKPRPSKPAPLDDVDPVPATTDDGADSATCTATDCYCTKGDGCLEAVS